MTRVCDGCMDLEYLTKTELSKILECCTDTVTRRIKENRIPEPDAKDGRVKLWKKETISKITNKEIDYSQIKSKRTLVCHGPKKGLEPEKIRAFNIANSLFNKSMVR